MSESTNGRETADIKRFFWLREDFDHLIDLLPRVDLVPIAGRSPSICDYPKTTRQALVELRLRGLHVDGPIMNFIMKYGKACTSHKNARDRWETLAWEKEHIDAAADWLFETGKWSSRTHFCANSNLRYGQVVKAYCVAAARFGLPFVMGFDLTSLTTVIEPSETTDGYAYIRFFPFFPEGSKMDLQEVTA